MGDFPPPFRYGPPGGPPFRPPGGLGFGPRMGPPLGPPGMGPGGMPPRMAGAPMRDMWPPGGPGPLMRPPDPSGPPPNPLAAPKNTTIYVGKIASTLDDDAIMKLLEACGKVKQWKPVKDPSNNKPKGFGFVEYEDAEGVLRALRLLNGVKIDGQELLMKSNTATQKYLEAYEQQRDQQRRAKAAKQQQEGDKEGEGKSAEPDLDEAALDEANDNAALEIIMSIASEREAAMAAVSAQSKDVNDVLTGAGLDMAHFSDRHSRDSDAGRSREPGHPEHRDRPRERGREGDRDWDRRERDRERQLEREFEQQRQRQRREEELRERELAKQYRMALERWEHRERDMAREQERERERQRDLERERARHIRQDMEAPDTDDELEPWERRPITSSRRFRDRQKRRLREEEEDAADRRREQEERAAAGVADDLEPDVKRARPGLQADMADTGLGEDDPLLKAMLTAAKEQQQQAGATSAASSDGASPITPDVSGGASAPPPAAAVASTATGPARVAPAPATAAVAAPLGRPAGRGRAAVSALFGDDEDEGATKKRKLVPIQYSEEELRAVEDQDAVAAAAAGAATAVAAAAAGGGSQELDSKMIMRKIMDGIPTNADGVFTYPIKWAHFTPASASRVAAWVGKKVTELLGEEEPTLKQFIMDMLASHTPGGKLEAEVSAILDNEARAFALKLYRMVIYESEKNALGIKDP